MLDLAQFIQNLTKNKMQFRERIKIRREMLVHSQGASAKDLILKKHTHETAATFKWRCENYRCITKSVFDRGINSLYRIFKDSSFSIDISETSKDYLNSKTFYRLPFMTFVNQYCLRTMIEDPNGWLAWIPTGKMNGENVPIEPMPILVTSEMQYYQSDDVIVFSESNCDKTHNPEYLHLLTKDIYLKLEYDGKKYNVAYDDENNKIFYPHGIEEIPYTTLGGHITSKGAYESYFSSFLQFANETIVLFSDWQATHASCSYPIVEMQDLPCPAQGCKNGKINNELCGTCSGTGKFQFGRSDVFDVLVRPIANSNLGREEAQKPMISYIMPPIEVVQYQRESWEFMLKKCSEALHLNFVDEAQSGVAKALDREEHYAMLEQISQNIFDNILFQSLWFVERYLDLNSPQMPNVMKPTDFRITTEDELEQKYADLMQGGAPSQLLVDVYLELVYKKMGGNQVKMKVAKYLTNYDVLFGRNELTCKILTDDGIVSDFEMRKHTDCNRVLNLLIQEKGQKWFMETELSIVDTEVEKLIEETFSIIQSDPNNNNDQFINSPKQF